MSGLVTSIASLILGVVATVWVSRYYFKRTVDKALTPYIQFSSSLFEGVDPSVRQALTIDYKGTSVKELLEIQFLIANTGERPIKDLIKPLTLIIPAGCTLLDASMLHIAPDLVINAQSAAMSSLWRRFSRSISRATSRVSLS